MVLGLIVGNDLCMKASQLSTVQRGFCLQFTDTFQRHLAAMWRATPIDCSRGPQADYLKYL